MSGSLIELYITQHPFVNNYDLFSISLCVHWFSCVATVCLCCLQWSGSDVVERGVESDCEMSHFLFLNVQVRSSSEVCVWNIPFLSVGHGASACTDILGFLTPCALKMQSNEKHSDPFLGPNLLIFGWRPFDRNPEYAGGSRLIQKNNTKWKSF